MDRLPPENIYRLVEEWRDHRGATRHSVKWFESMDDARDWIRYLLTMAQDRKPVSFRRYERQGSLTTKR